MINLLVYLFICFGTSNILKQWCFFYKYHGTVITFHPELERPSHFYWKDSLTVFQIFLNSYSSSLNLPLIKECIYLCYVLWNTVLIRSLLSLFFDFRTTCTQTCAFAPSSLSNFLREIPILRDNHEIVYGLYLLWYCTVYHHMSFRWVLKSQTRVLVSYSM